MPYIRGFLLCKEYVGRSQQCVRLKVVLWSKNHFLFSLRFWKHIRFTSNWLWALRFIRRLFILSVSFGFDGPPLLSFKLTDRPSEGWIWRKWRHLPTSLTFQHVNAIYYIWHYIFDVIFSSTQLSQNFKVSNGWPINKKIPVKINRCLFKIRT